MIRIFWKKVYELNPRYESLRIRKDLDSRIFIVKDLDSRIFIVKDLFCAIVLRICKDSLDS